VLSDFYFKAKGSKRDPTSREHERVIKAEHTDFIRSRTTIGVPIVILSENDWHYLLDAKRPSLLYWTPLHLTHTYSLLTRNMEQLKKAEIIFLEKGYSDTLNNINEHVWLKVFETINRDYDHDAADSNWIVLYRKKQ
jgi:hypothetical protein